MSGFSYIEPQTSKQDNFMSENSVDAEDAYRSLLNYNNQDSRPYFNTNQNTLQKFNGNNNPPWSKNDDPMNFMTGNSENQNLYESPPYGFSNSKYNASNL